MLETISEQLEQQVEAIRQFNRFYTRQIGVLNEALLKSAFSLVEVRVLYELAYRENLTASILRKDLDLDAGYLSRILRDFQERGLIEKRPSEEDGRQSLLSLSPKGTALFQELNNRSCEEVRFLLQRLPQEEQNRLIKSMETIREILDCPSESKQPYLLRSQQPGDLGWIIHRHGLLYAQEYGWDESFEALVAEIAAQFIQNYNPKRERCWVAEKDGEIVGSIMLVEHSENVAKLRLLLVEPKARGLGLGHRLVQECIQFAKIAGYQKITLWTNQNLHAARSIYQKTGFQLVQEEPHHSFGYDLIGETWELDL